MCPSYMATRDEAHSTRGRANVLRLAMTGQLGPQGLDDPGLHEALDLCLECRACKSECPVSVDMARIKSEVLAGHWKRHGAPLKVKAFGHVRRLARWGSRLAPLSNLMAGSPLGRALGERTAGIDRRRCRRCGPAARCRDGRRRGRRPPRHGRCSSPTRSPSTSIPHIGEAALDVLQHAGIGARAGAARLLRRVR